MPQKKKKIPTKHLLIGGLFYTLLFAGASENITGSDTDNNCGGTELWEQKILVDDGASTISKLSVDTTIEAINNIPSEEESRTVEDPSAELRKAGYYSS